MKIKELCDFGEYIFDTLDIHSGITKQDNYIDNGSGCKEFQCNSVKSGVKWCKSISEIEKSH